MSEEERRAFWKQAFIASLGPPPTPLQWWASGTIQLGPHITVAPASAAAIQADQALAELDRRWPSAPPAPHGPAEAL